jgi:hypothetical protein
MSVVPWKRGRFFTTESKEHLVPRMKILCLLVAQRSKEPARQDKRCFNRDRNPPKRCELVIYTAARCEACQCPSQACPGC